MAPVPLAGGVIPAAPGDHFSLSPCPRLLLIPSPSQMCWRPGAVHLGTGHSDSSPVTSTQGHRGTALPGLRGPFPPFLRGCPCPCKGRSAWLLPGSEQCLPLLQLAALRLPLVARYGSVPEAVPNHFNKDKSKSTGGRCSHPPASSVRNWPQARAATCRVTAGRGPACVCHLPAAPPAGQPGR